MEKNENANLIPEGDHPDGRRGIQGILRNTREGRHVGEDRKYGRDFATCGQ
ncbi:MAG: hypothetical protein ABIF87_16205 [Pseudomonadota bacterium]